jgi:hypothetical protein
MMDVDEFPVSLQGDTPTFRLQEPQMQGLETRRNLHEISEEVTQCLSTRTFRSSVI